LKYTLETLNGMPLYLLGKIVNDFNPIFCQAHDKSINFIGARNHLAVHLKFVRYKSFRNDENFNWDSTYAFDSDEVKRNISWFMKKSNAIKAKALNITPYESNLNISNEYINGKLTTFVEKPPLPNIPTMEGGIKVRIIDLKEMINQLKPLNEEVVKLTFSKSKITMCGLTYESPIHKVSISMNSKFLGNDGTINTLCFKEMLLRSCQLAVEVSSRAEFSFYPGGAAQIFAKNNNIFIRCLLTAVETN